VFRKEPQILLAVVAGATNDTRTMPPAMVAIAIKVAQAILHAVAADASMTVPGHMMQTVSHMEIKLQEACAHQMRCLSRTAAFLLKRWNLRLRLISAQRMVLRS
jgi:hypothetical protein